MCHTASVVDYGKAGRDGNCAVCCCTEDSELNSRTWLTHSRCKRREKEMLKALAQQERQATRSRQRDAHAGPRDDLDIEMEALLAKQQQSYPG